jgi:hypothetical protein
MHLKAHKLVLMALLLFGVGLLTGTSLGNMYRRHARDADFARHVKSELNSGIIDPVVTNGDFPREVAGMVRTNLLTEEKAEEFVYSFLGKERVLSSAYISTYKDADREVVIFVAIFYSPWEAEEVLTAMKKTLQGKDIFKECSEKSILDDVTVNYLRDDKNSHYFYSKGNRVIWLMAGAEECIEILTDFYRYF